MLHHLLVQLFWFYANHILRSTFHFLEVGLKLTIVTLLGIQDD